MKNPIYWLKLAYETFGVNHPKASLIVVTILGALIFAGVWHFAAVQYYKDQKAQAVATVPPTVTNTTTTNTTTGGGSPITTGNGNNISYDDSSPQKKGASQPKKGNGQ